MNRPSQKIFDHLCTFFNPFTLERIVSKCADETRARQLFERLRWPRGIRCPRCNHGEFYRLQSAPETRCKTRPGVYSCANCRKPFTATSGTLFASGHLPISKWLILLFIISKSGGKIPPGLHISRIVGVTYQTAWLGRKKLLHFMEHGFTGKPYQPGPIKPRNVITLSRSVRKGTAIHVRERLRIKLVEAVLASGGTLSLQEIVAKTCPEIKLEGASFMLNTARRMPLLNCKAYGVIPQIIIRPPKQVRPQYDRPEIQNERETEIPLLVNRRQFQSLDAPVFDGDDTGHSIFGSSDGSPLEILLMKEQVESEEFQSREKRIDLWNRWAARKSSAHAKELQFA